MKPTSKSPLRVRIAYEPNRFSVESLKKVYDHLVPARPEKEAPDERSEKGSRRSPKRSEVRS